MPPKCKPESSHSSKPAAEKHAAEKPAGQMLTAEAAAPEQNASGGPSRKPEESHLKSTGPSPRPQSSHVTAQTTAAAAETDG